MLCGMGIPPPSGPGEPPQGWSFGFDRVYLERRLQRHEVTAGRLERRAAAAAGQEAEVLLSRAKKHRERAERIREHLRGHGTDDHAAE
jgi:predicted outer membrane protein